MRTVFTLLAGAGAVSAWSELLHQPIMHKNIDAIVEPGVYSSHMHTFFGSDIITNVMPTTEDLQQGCYSGLNANDLSAYWIPTLYHVDGDNFTEVPVFTFGTYYTARYAEIPIPPNFAAISGKASAKTQEEANHPENGLEWYCENSDEREPDVARMPTKACEQHLRFSLLFPNCVNPDDVSQHAFSDSASNRCPEGMKRMPQLRFSARYNTKAVAPNGWDGVAPFQLSCSDTPGDGYCFHGDFINGWFEDAALDMLLSDGNGRDDGRFISGARGSSATWASCTPVDRDPDNGTGDYFTSLEMMANARADANTDADTDNDTDADGDAGPDTDIVPTFPVPANNSASAAPESTPTPAPTPTRVSVPANSTTKPGRRIGQKSRTSAKWRQSRVGGSQCSSRQSRRL